MEFLIAVLVLGVLIIAAAVGYNWYVRYSKELAEKQDSAHKAWLKKIDDEIKALPVQPVQKKSLRGSAIHELEQRRLIEKHRFENPNQSRRMEQQMLDQNLHTQEMEKIRQQILEQKELQKQLKIESLERELRQNLGPSVKLFNGEWKDIRDIIELVKKNS